MNELIKEIVQAQRQALKEIRESDFIKQQIEKAFKEIFGESK